MKAITLWQPWASLWIAGIKPFETRSWAPPAKLIGQRIAIHAAKRPMVETIPLLGEGRMDVLFDAASAAGVDDFPYGMVLGTGILSGAYEYMGPGIVPRAVKGSVPRLSIFPDIFGDYSLGRWVWKLEGNQRFPGPTPVKGKQGFWEWNPEGVQA